MSEKTIRKQIRTLYLMTTIGYFQIAAASWVALLALRGFSLLQIGMLESIFHIVSLCFELPSGIVADVFGRRKTLIASQIASLISGTLMIFSTGFATTALALGCSALSYNLASGTREALAYDSLKQNGDEGFYARFSSTEMMLYRITNSTATLCAGLALWLGYRRAYAIHLFFGSDCAWRFIPPCGNKNGRNTSSLSCWTGNRFRLCRKAGSFLSVRKKQEILCW